MYYPLVVYCAVCGVPYPRVLYCASVSREGGGGPALANPYMNGSVMLPHRTNGKGTVQHQWYSTLQNTASGVGGGRTCPKVRYNRTKHNRKRHGTRCARDGGTKRRATARHNAVPSKVPYGTPKGTVRAINSQYGTVRYIQHCQSFKFTVGMLVASTAQHSTVLYRTLRHARCPRVRHSTVQYHTRRLRCVRG